MIELNQFDCFPMVNLPQLLLANFTLPGFAHSMSASSLHLFLLFYISSSLFFPLVPHFSFPLSIQFNSSSRFLYSLHFEILTFSLQDSRFTLFFAELFKNPFFPKYFAILTKKTHFMSQWCISDSACLLLFPFSMHSFLCAFNRLLYGHAMRLFLSIG